MKEIDNLLIFYPDRGLGDLLFTHTEKEIMSILGEPEEITKDQYDDNEYSIDLYYGGKYSFFSSTNYENDNFDRTDFFLRDLILDRVCFSDLSKGKILEYIKLYHIKYGYEYKIKFEYQNDVEQECYSFDSIGITIWFNGADLSVISNICISKVFEE